MTSPDAAFRMGIAWNLRVLKNVRLPFSREFSLSKDCPIPCHGLGVSPCRQPFIQTTERGTRGVLGIMDHSSISFD